MALLMSMAPPPMPPPAGPFRVARKEASKKAGKASRETAPRAAPATLESTASAVKGTSFCRSSSMRLLCAPGTMVATCVPPSTFRNVTAFWSAENCAFSTRCDEISFIIAENAIGGGAAADAERGVSVRAAAAATVAALECERGFKDMRLTRQKIPRRQK